MERARKWVMVPEENESRENSVKNDIPTIERDDILKLIKLAKSDKVTADGHISEDNKNVADVFECMTKKSSARNYNKYLENLVSQPKQKDAKSKKKNIKKTSNGKNPWAWE